jgi:hypothetical protein
LKKLDPRPSNYNRLSETEQRRLELNNSYKELMKSINSSKDATKTATKLKAFLAREPHTASFLYPSSSSSWISNPKLRSGLPDFQFESLVCVQLGNSYWSEEYMGLSQHDLVFIKPSYKLRNRKSRLVIAIPSILDVHALIESDAVFHIDQTHYLLISTFSRQYMLMFRDQDLRNRWLDAIRATIQCSMVRLQAQGVANSSPILSQADHSIIAMSAGIGEYESVDISCGISSGRKHHMNLLVRSKSYAMGDREILNARSFSKHFLRYFARSSLTSSSANAEASQASSASNSSSSFTWTAWTSYLDQPVLMVEKLLQKAFTLSRLMNHPSADQPASSSATAAATYSGKITQGKSSEQLPHPMDESSMEYLSPMLAAHWIDFLDGVSLLQVIDLNLLSLLRSFDKDATASEEILCLMLNLYHCMLLHGFLVMGLPDGMLKWPSFYGVISYDAFGDIFSLSELEHCILRHGKLSVGVIAHLSHTILYLCTCRHGSTKHQYICLELHPEPSIRFLGQSQRLSLILGVELRILVFVQVCAHLSS